MSRSPKDGDERAVKERVRLLLFFGKVADVDVCKFKFNDDIEGLLHPVKRRSDVHLEDPYP